MCDVQEVHNNECCVCIHLVTVINCVLTSSSSSVISSVGAGELPTVKGTLWQ